MRIDEHTCSRSSAAKWDRPFALIVRSVLAILSNVDNFPDIDPMLQQARNFQDSYGNLPDEKSDRQGP